MNTQFAAHSIENNPYIPMMAEILKVEPLTQRDTFF